VYIVLTRIYIQFIDATQTRYRL